MARVVDVQVTGEELARRIRVQLEFSIQDAEQMLNQELIRQVAAKISGAWIRLNKRKLDHKFSVEEVIREVNRAIVDKAVFNLAVERAQNGDPRA